MSEKKIKEQQGEKKQILLENPYDLETFFESLSISSDSEKELLFVDRLIAGVRLDPEVEIAELSYKILTELKLMNGRN
jgi:hypothetical protein